jgi:hypothetical protein
MPITSIKLNKYSMKKETKNKNGSSSTDKMNGENFIKPLFFQELCDGWSKQCTKAPPHRGFPLVFTESYLIKKIELTSELTRETTGGLP